MFHDSRGYFFEASNEAKLAAAGRDLTFVQANVSCSLAGVLRGLHYQWPNPQGKLVQVFAGSIWDVAVDIRESSPTMGEWFGLELSSENHRALYIPPGFAHGFCVLGDECAIVSYQCTTPYQPANDAGVRWDDPTLKIDWPVKSQIILSDKDQALPTLAEMASERRPKLTF